MSLRFLPLSACCVVAIVCGACGGGSSPSDAGFPADAGFRADAGFPADAGFRADAGFPADAGVAADGGAALDAGLAPDGGPLAPGETCDNAIPITGSTLLEDQDTTPLRNDHDPGGAGSACPDLTQLTYDGRDAAYSVSIPPGTTLTVTVTPIFAWDVAAAIVGDCGQAASTCLSGSDNVRGEETVTYTNTTATARVVYVLVDSFDRDEFGLYDIDIQVQ